MRRAVPQGCRPRTLPEIDPAWIAEAERRYRDYREGRVEGIQAEQVFDDIEQELGWSGRGASEESTSPL